MSKPRVIVLVLVLTVFAAAGLAYFIQGGSTSPSNPQAASNTSSSGNSSDQPASAGSDAGLFSKPSSNPTARVQQQPANSTTIGQAAAASSPSSESLVLDTEACGTVKHNESNEVYGYGRTPAVAPDANANVKSVVEAIQTKSHPERLSALIAPAKFDKAAYEADPAAYLAVSEPGRVYQTAQPGKGVPVLRPASPQFVAMTQGETIELTVKGIPAVGNNAGNDASGGTSGGPVTFTSADLGRFENELTSITVAADASGVAKVHFTAPPGTINTVRILCGSPLATGQVEFVVQVEPAPGTSESLGSVVPASSIGEPSGVASGG